MAGGWLRLSRKERKDRKKGGSCRAAGRPGKKGGGPASLSRVGVFKGERELPKKEMRGEENFTERERSSGLKPTHAIGKGKGEYNRF